MATHRISNLRASSETEGQVLQCDKNISPFFGEVVSVYAFRRPSPLSAFFGILDTLVDNRFLAE